MKAGVGNDHLSIAWKYPGKEREVIPARFSRVKNPSKLQCLSQASAVTYCNSKFCTQSVWDTNVTDGLSCGRKIELLQSQGRTMSEACAGVSMAFPSICTCSPTTAMGLQSEEDILLLAKAAIALKLRDASLTTAINFHTKTKSPESLAQLKNQTMSALALGTDDDFANLLDPKKQIFVPALYTWNMKGTEPATTDAGIVNVFGLADTERPTKRVQLCNQISSKDSLVGTTIKDCVCGDKSPYVRCVIMLGDATFEHHRRRRRDRELQLSSSNSHQQDNPVSSSMNANRDLSGILGTCSLSGSIFPSFLDFVKFCTGDGVSLRGMNLKGQCSMNLPPPLTFLQMSGEVSVQVPDEEWTSVEGALKAITAGTMTKQDIKQKAERAYGRIQGSVCFLDAGIIQDILEFLGLGFCFTAR